jgi:hypothetical protein
LKSSGYEFDEEAIRTIKLVPEHWFPGILDGKAVDIEVTLPCNFQHPMTGDKA